MQVSTRTSPAGSFAGGAGDLPEPGSLGDLSPGSFTQSSLFSASPGPFTGFAPPGRQEESLWQRLGNAVRGFFGGEEPEKRAHEHEHHRCHGGPPQPQQQWSPPPGAQQPPPGPAQQAPEQAAHPAQGEGGMWSQLMQSMRDFFGMSESDESSQGFWSRLGQSMREFFGMSDADGSSEGFWSKMGQAVRSFFGADQGDEEEPAVQQPSSDGDIWSAAKAFFGFGDEGSGPTGEAPPSGDQMDPTLWGRMKEFFS